MGKQECIGVFKYFDSFAKPVTFTFNHSLTHRTACGGILSLIVLVLMCIYTAIIIANPLKASRGSISLLDAAEDVSNSTEGSVSAGIVEINGTSYEATYAVKKFKYPSQVHLDETEYYPQENGFMFAVDFLNLSFDYTKIFIEMYAVILNNDDVIEYEAVEVGLCSKDDFPEEFEDELRSYGIFDYFICPKDFGNFSFIKNRDGNNFRFLEVDAVTCLGLDECEDYDTLLNETIGENMRFFWVENYFDEKDPLDPIKYRLTRGRFVTLNIDAYLDKMYRIKLNKVKKLDGTTQNFNELVYHDFTYYKYNEGNPYSSMVMFELSDDYDYYEQYIDYNPHFESEERRNLASESKDSIMSNEYFAFYIMAQLGGLYSFFSLILSGIISYISNKTFLYDGVNSIHSNRTIQNSKSYAPGQSYFSKSRVLPEEEKSSNLSNNQMPMPERAPFINKTNKGTFLKSLGHHLAKTTKPITNNYNLQRFKSEDQDNQHDGGEESESIFRRKSAYDTEDRFNTNDLIYALLHCARPRGTADRVSRKGRCIEFYNEARVFNEERDLVNIMASINIFREKIELLEIKLSDYSQRLTELEDSSLGDHHTAKANLLGSNLRSRLGTGRSEMNSNQNTPSAFYQNTQIQKGEERHWYTSALQNENNIGIIEEEKHQNPNDANPIPRSPNPKMDPNYSISQSASISSIAEDRAPIAPREAVQAINSILSQEVAKMSSQTPQNPDSNNDISDVLFTHKPMRYADDQSRLISQAEEMLKSRDPPGVGQGSKQGRKDVSHLHMSTIVQHRQPHGPAKTISVGSSEEEEEESESSYSIPDR